MRHHSLCSEAAFNPWHSLLVPFCTTVQLCACLATYLAEPDPDSDLHFDFLDLSQTYHYSLVWHSPDFWLTLFTFTGRAPLTLFQYRGTVHLSVRPQPLLALPSLSLLAPSSSSHAEQSALLLPDHHLEIWVRQPLHQAFLVKQVFCLK